MWTAGWVEPGDKWMMETTLGWWPCGHHPRMVPIIHLSAAPNPLVGSPDSTGGVSSLVGHWGGGVLSLGGYCHWRGTGVGEDRGIVRRGIVWSGIVGAPPALHNLLISFLLPAYHILRILFLVTKPSYLFDFIFIYYFIISY